MWCRSMVKFSFKVEESIGYFDCEPWQGDPTKEQIAAMNPHEKFDAAFAFAERAWHRPWDDDFANEDFYLAYGVAHYDAEYFDGLLEWTRNNADEIPDDLKLFLFDLFVVSGRPRGGRKSSETHHRDGKIRYIGSVLKLDYGYELTANEASRSESAASIIERIGIPGGKAGEQLSKRTIERILTR